LTDALDLYEAWHSSGYRQKAVDEIYEHICADDKVSHGISIGPVRALRASCHKSRSFAHSYSIVVSSGNMCQLMNLQNFGNAASCLFSEDIANWVCCFQ